MKANTRQFIERHHRCKAVNRADLVYWLLQTGESPESLKRIAHFAGFELQQPPESQPQTFTSTIEWVEARPVSPITLSTESSPKLSPKWFRVAERTHLKPDDSVTPIFGPLSIQGVADLTEADLQPHSKAAPPGIAPLVCWSRLWPVLKQVLSVMQNGQLDVPRLVNQIANGKVLHKLPRQRHLHWSSELMVLLDFNARTLPFWDDFNDLCEALIDLRGCIGLDVRKLERIPGEQYSRWRQPESHSQSWKMPPPDTPLLILSDLGMLDTKESSIRRHWLRFGRQLKAAGLMPFVLAPISPNRVDPELCRYFHIVLWSKNSRLQRQRQCRVRDNQPHIHQLLILLSPAIRIEPELLRAVRHLLPAEEFDAGCEAEFWQHPDVDVSPVACAIRNEVLEKYRSGFCHQPVELQRRVIMLIRQYHAHLFPAVWYEETLIWASLVAVELAAEFKADIAQAELFMRKMARMLYRQRDTLAESKQAYGLRHLDRSHTALRSRHLYYSVLEGIVNREKLDEGFPVRAGIDHDELMRTLSSDSLPNRQCTLYQQGSELIIAEKDTSNASTIQSGSRYADINLTGVSLFIQQELDGGSQPECYLQLTELPKSLATLTQDVNAIYLRTHSETLILSGFTKPDWIGAMGRSAQGLFVEFKQRGVIWLIYWPEWGGQLDYDDYGLYADLNLRGITQRFRWIAPGDFLMGSPETEPERESWDKGNETQHSVTLTQGYWLADTACTQALWQAVMGANPAEFKDNPNNPVETVSWDDVQDFIAKLNELVPGLKACLPTEAQWEYACRAGTSTPFSFGENINPQQVNYEGNYPYAGGEKGLYRQKTVPVKSLPANPWGLYEMHGNVYEWCSDWYGHYPSGPATDPGGPPDGADRVLRGGSWSYVGWSARSANRYGYTPDSRYQYFGFRLALGQTVSGKAGVECAADADRRSGSEAGQRQGRERLAETESVQSSQDKNFISRFFERKKPK